LLSFVFSSIRRHTRSKRDWSSDVCSSDLYFPVPPNDQMADLRDEICAVLEETGLSVERAHHEVGTAGQQEINYRFNTLLQAADEIGRASCRERVANSGVVVTVHGRQSLIL